MSSTTEEAWNDMKSSETERTGACASRIHRILNGSKQAKPRSNQRRRNKMDRKQQGEGVSLVGLGSKVAVSSISPAFKQVQRRCSGQSPKAEGDPTPSITLAEAVSVQDVSETLLAGWLRNKHGAADRDTSVRKSALQKLAKDISAVVKEFGEIPSPIPTAPSANPSENETSFLEDLMAILMDDLARILFNGLADPAEACREASIRAVTLFVEHVTDLTPHLAYLFPVLMARGVPAGSLFDPALELFVHDADEHEAFKRGRATERQDHHIPLVQHVAEGSEELRLALCRMVGRMLLQLMSRGTIGVLRPYLDDTILYLVSRSRDAYPTVKVEALSIITKLATHPHLEQGMKFYSVGLSRAILPHLRHRHAKVRLAAVEALWVTVKVPDRAKVKGAGTAAIVDLVGFREDNVLPVAAFYGRGDTTVNYLAELTTDRSVSVREATTAMLGDWLTHLPDRYDHQTRLLPYVLNAITDETKVVSTIAVECLSACGAEYEREHQDDVIERRQFGVDGDVRANHTKPLPRPFTGRPRIGARLFVRSNTRRFLLPLLVELSNWISRTRLQSAILFRTLIVYCEEHLTVETHKLIPHLQRALHLAVSAKDKRLEDVLLECCELVGRYVMPGSYLPHMLSRIREEPEVNPTGTRATLLTILSKLLEGAVPKVLALHTSDIVNAVTERCEDIADEAAPVRRATIRVLRAIAISMKSHGRQAAVEITFAGTGRLSSVERPVISAVAYLLACTSLGDSPSELMECLRSLAKACDFVDEQALVAAHTVKLVEGICEEYPIGPVWSRACVSQLTFEALLSVCPQAPEIHPDVVPLLISLSEQIVSKLQNFQEGDQEGVLTVFVGAVALGAIGVWRYEEEPSPRKNSKHHGGTDNTYRRVLNLGLSDCWHSTPSLRHWKMDILAAFADKSARRGFLSTHTAEVSVTAHDIAATVVDLVGHPQVCVDDACKGLTVVSRILHTAGCMGIGSCTYSRKLTPFSSREAMGAGESSSEGLDGSAMAAKVYMCFLAKLDDTNEEVRLCALKALGEIIPFLHPDRVGYQRPLPEQEERRDECEVGWTEDRCTADADRSMPLFSDFVQKCTTYARTMTLTPECADELDVLLRRAACLDPDAFASVISRALKEVVLAGSTRQLLFNLADHASVLAALQRGG